MNLNNLVPWATIVNEVENLTQKSIELFSKGDFNLNKWYSNILFLQSTSNSSVAIYAKQIIVVQ